MGGEISLELDKTINNIVPFMDESGSIVEQANIPLIRLAGSDTFVPITSDKIEYVTPKKAEKQQFTHLCK